jgi:hypothetical protein
VAPPPRTPHAVTGICPGDSPLWTRKAAPLIGSYSPDESMVWEWQVAQAAMFTHFSRKFKEDNHGRAVDKPARSHLPERPGVVEPDAGDAHVKLMLT